MFLSSFASLSSRPVSRSYYQRKRQQGKRHNQAVLALPHRRTLTLHAVIRNNTPTTHNHQNNHPQPLDEPHKCPQKDPTTAARHTADRHTHVP